MEDDIIALKELYDDRGICKDVLVALNDIWLSAVEADGDNYSSHQEEFFNLVEEYLSFEVYVPDEQKLVKITQNETLRLSIWPVNSVTQVFLTENRAGPHEWRADTYLYTSYECYWCGSTHSVELHKVGAFSRGSNGISCATQRICTQCFNNHTRVDIITRQQFSELLSGPEPDLVTHHPTLGTVEVRVFSEYSYENARRNTASRDIYTINSIAASWDIVEDRPQRLNTITTEAYMREYEGASLEARVFNYSTSPFSVFGTRFLLKPGEAEPKNKRFYGVELEVEYDGISRGRDAVSSIASLVYPYGILTSDASLHEGFEIKTLPATMKAHYLIWERFFDGKPNKFVSSWKSGRCGQHVHVSADSISPMTLGKINMFINNPLNWDFVSLIAGRNIRDNGFCYPVSTSQHITSAFVSQSVIRKYEKTYQKSYRGKGGRVPVEHHNAFVSREMGGKPTYEFRIFRGNLSKPGFLKNLEFVDALITWLEDVSAREVSLANFKEWLQVPVHAAHYRYLMAYLEDKKIFSKVRGLTVYHDEEKELRT